ncbi:MAG: DUF123 domain-containing protein [Pseudothermotoga sp.]
MKGAYILLVNLFEPLVMKVSRNEWFFKPGLYAYVGSAMNSLERRISRHLAKNKKKHWHIDYLLEKATVQLVLMIRSDEKIEEEISRIFAKYFECIENFGASDLRVKSNLFYIDSTRKFFEVVSSIHSQGFEKSRSSE